MRRDHFDAGRGAPPETDWSGHGYEHLIEDVPIESLRHLREYDREAPGMATTDIGKLADDIQRHGIKEPLMILYGQKDRRAKLGEGNHRLAAAERLGMTHLPARVLRQSQMYGEGAPVPGVEPNQHGYVRGDLRPSEIGLPVRRRNDKPGAW